TDPTKKCKIALERRHNCDSFFSFSSMKRRLIFGFVGALLAVNLFIGAAKVYSSSSSDDQKDAVYPNMRLFSEVMEKVRRDYVDGTNLTYQDLVYGALKGMVNALA